MPKGPAGSSSNVGMLEAARRGQPTNGFWSRRVRTGAQRIPRRAAALLEKWAAAQEGHGALFLGAGGHRGLLREKPKL